MTLPIPVPGPVRLMRLCALASGSKGNCIFDVLAPYDCHLSNEEIDRRVKHAFSDHDPKLFAVITIDRSFVNFQPTHA